jgi:hypothetical protein
LERTRVDGQGGGTVVKVTFGVGEAATEEADALIVPVAQWEGRSHGSRWMPGFWGCRARR